MMDAELLQYNTIQYKFVQRNSRRKASSALERRTNNVQTDMFLGVS